jgi:hypothetical protein
MPTGDDRAPQPHPREPRQPPDQVLSYRRPPDVEPPRGRDVEGLLGCLSTASLFPIGVVVIGLVGYVSRLPGWVMLSLNATLFAVPLAVGLALRKSQRWRELAAGLLFGLAIAALIEGIWFVSTWK